MDRNFIVTVVAQETFVATRGGGVDRNEKLGIGNGYPQVATRGGGVDRNVGGMNIYGNGKMSPPAGVAWIEMCNYHADSWYLDVATRGGGVDRNFYIARLDFAVDFVATRGGGVDRNTKKTHTVAHLALSPPAGVAWIEIVFIGKPAQTVRQSPPAGVAWIEMICFKSSKN